MRIVSPENARVSPGSAAKLTATNSATSFITNLPIPVQKCYWCCGYAHYYDSSFNPSDVSWAKAGLKAVVDNKPVWVTESAKLKSEDTGMDDAAQYAKWITRGFNEGGMTGYMVIFY